MSKLAKATSEQSKQVLRKVRQKGIGDVRKNKQGRSEDDIKRVEKMVRGYIYCCLFTFFNERKNATRENKYKNRIDR